MIKDDIKKEITKQNRVIKENYEVWLTDLLKQNDMQGLNNVIFQATRQSLIPISCGGYDHCWWIWHILDSIACGDYDTITRRLPHELGFSKNGYPFYIHAVNMFMGIWYKDKAMIDKALPKAEKFVSSKNSQWERAVVSYLCNLYKRDVSAMESDLQWVCDSYGKMSIDKSKKLLCVNAYGLMMLAYLIYPDLSEIKLPENKNFSKEYAKWRLDNRNPEFGLYGLKDITTEYYRKLLMSPVAIGKNHQPYLDSENEYISLTKKKDWYVDAEGMLNEFVNDIKNREV